MRKLLVCLVLCYSIISNAQNVGIGTSSPAARLHVTDSAVVFQGPLQLPATTTFAPPVLGPGSRMFWYPQKAAFRTGIVDNASWDKDSIGRYSFAAGFNVRAFGEGSVAMGSNTMSRGSHSVSVGYFNQALGTSSFSFGSGSFASGEFSGSMGTRTRSIGANALSMGLETDANGNYSTSMGSGTVADGDFSTSMGRVTVAKGNNSTSMGAYTRAVGITSTALGSYNVARSNNTLVAGTFNDTSLTNSLFEIGNGTADNARNNAFTVLTNGNIGIGISNPDAPVTFPSLGGEKIALFPFSATQRHGFGVFLAPTYSAMRFYVPAQGDYISWGTGSNTSFTENMSLEGNGVLRVRTSVIAPYAFAPSDLRFKQGLQPIADPLGKISYLNGYTYHYRTEGFPEKQFSEREQVGVVAQEVEAVMPQAVSTDADGYKSVDYSKLVPLLIEGIKTQQQQIQQQQELVNQLLKRVEELEKKKER